MPRTIALTCPNCDAPLHAPEEIDRIFCQFCGTPVVVQQPTASHADSPDNNRVVPIPERLTVEEHGDDLKLSWTWFSWAVLFLIPFCIAWNAFLIGWYGMAGAFGGDMPGPMWLVFLVFPIGHVAVGLGLIYAVLVLLLNRTSVSVRNGQLSVSHGPIWFPGSQTHSIDDVEQLYVTRETTHGKNNTINHKHPVMLQLKSGRSVKLVWSTTDRDVARAVEYLVEKRLRIADVRVEGEHRGA